jgi:hypothetical protein
MQGALDHAGNETNVYKMDYSLDCVPVKQPRNPVDRVPDDLTTNVNPGNVIQSKAKKLSPIKQEVLTRKLTSTIETPKFGKDVLKMATALNPNPPLSQKRLMNAPSSMTTDVLLRNLQSSLRLVTEDTEGSVENSFSLSKIADYLGIIIIIS